MFVFGSTLFGPEKKTKDDAEDIEEAARRDAQIARLKNREERLLAELAMTRNRINDTTNNLKGGSTLDNAALMPPNVGSAIFESQYGSATMPDMRGREIGDLPFQANNFFMDSSIGNGKSVMVSKGPSRQNSRMGKAKSTTNLGRRGARRSTVPESSSYMASSLSSNSRSTSNRIRGGIDLLPILTSSGEGVFEVGLNNGDGSSEAVLPVFRLPQVNEQVQFINRIPTEPTLEEIQQAEEDRQDGEMVADVLGLTEEELAEFEMEVDIISGKAAPGGTSIVHPSEYGDSTMNLPPLDISQTIDGQHNMLREEGSTMSLLAQSQLPGKKRRRDTDPDQHGTRRTPRCLRANFRANSKTLRKELSVSINLIQDLTEKVREDIAEINRTVPIQNVKAQLYMQRWGMEKFEKIFKRIEMQKERAALQWWQHQVKESIKMEKKSNYMKFRASRKLDHFVHKMQANEMGSAFHKWLSQMLEEKQAERRALEVQSACVIQNLVRTFLARRHVFELKTRIREAKENAAASKIQAMYRGRATRRHVAEMLHNLEMNRAASYIQRAYRGRLGRKTYNQMRAAHRENKAILMIQNAWRSRCARKVLNIARAEAYKKKCATKIQKMMRGFLARKATKELMEQLFLKKMAIKIQAKIRGILGRKRFRRLKAEADKEKNRRHNAAIKIQSRFRAHRSQLDYMLKLQSHRAAMKYENGMATKIQKLWRGVLGRRRINDMKGVNIDEMVRLARMHQEMWDEDNSTYFYYCADKEEAVWEPPRTGYVKVDGKLVLRNGDVIPDPDDDPSKNAKKCVECEDDLAARYCTECDDAYCDKCFENTHASGKRAYHQWEPIGPTRCMECEKESATRWCVSCDDPYCESCYKKMHAKGKRALHEWNPIGEGPPEEAEEGEAGGDGDNATFMAAEGTVGQQEWQEYYDDDAGAPYWYNMTTGESSYANPFETQAGAVGIVDGYGSDYAGADGYDTGGGAGEWTEYYDEGSGAPYWYNAVSGETVWTDPNGGNEGAGTYGMADGYGSDYAAGASGYDTGGGGGDYTEYYDEATGAAYWYSETTGETLWESPY
jgi:hypothetical protein